jgi:sporulation protein YlmC with PRC-barrel domain
MKFELGSTIRCADGATRELVDVVIDSASGRVTHIVARPEEDAEGARLVPLAVVVPAKRGAESGLSLNCTAAELEGFDPVHEVEVIRPGEQRNQDPKWDVGVEDIVVSPDYAPTAYGDYAGAGESDVTIAYDRVPKGEIELRHASAVYSADGHHLGSVEAVVVDDEDRLTHLLLERGHLWWKREVELPADAIAKFESDMLTLGATKQQFAKGELHPH